MKSTILLIIAVLLLSIAVNAQGTGVGTYSNETYGNYTYGASSFENGVFNNFYLTLFAGDNFINASKETESYLVITANSGVTGYFTQVRYLKGVRPPTLSSASPDTAIFYYDFVAKSPVELAIDHTIFNVSYTDAQISGLQEDTLMLYLWNGSSWRGYSRGNVGALSADNNYIYANVSGPSLFGKWALTGIPIPAPSTPSGGGGGGGGGSDFRYECTDWSACADGVQTRTCTNIGSSPGDFNKPAETQSCTVPVAAEPAPAANTVTQEIPVSEEGAAPAAPAAGNEITGAATAPTGNAVTNFFTSAKGITATVVFVLILGAFYLGYYFLYRKPSI